LDIFGENNKAKFPGSLKRPRKKFLTLRIAPLVDLIFLLLIFFIVAAKWKPKEDFLPLQLPVANARTITSIGRPEPLAIAINPAQNGCQVQIGASQPVFISEQNPEQGLASLMETIKQCMSEQKRYSSDPVEIICARDVKWEHVAKIYNVLVGIGLKDITFQMTEDR